MAGAYTDDHIACLLMEALITRRPKECAGVPDGASMQVKEFAKIDLRFCFPLDSKRKIAMLRAMAEIDEKWPENVKGKFYVDEQCIDCDLCRETAPDFFTRNEDGGYSFVHAQPDSPEGEELCMEALEGCPVEAIGDDGDS